MAVPVVVTSLLVVEAVASATLVFRFVFAGLHQVYRFFFAYLIFFSIQLDGLLLFQPKKNAYAQFFFGTEAAIVFLYVMVTLELYSLVLRDLKGIATVALRYIRVAIATAILFSMLLLGMEQTPKDVISIFFSFERPIVSSLIFFVLLITAFLCYYPIPLNRNVIYYTIGYAVYFGSKATILLFINTGRYRAPNLSTIMMSISAACLIFWVFALTRQGEKKSQISGPRWSKDDETRTLDKLAELNASLLRTSKKSIQSKPE